MATSMNVNHPRNKRHLPMATGRGHNVTQYKNGVNRTNFDLGEYPELNSKIIDSNILVHFQTLRKDTIYDPQS